MSVFQKVEEIRHFCRSGYSLKKIYEILCKSEKLFSYARRLPEFQEFVCVTEKDTEAKFLFSYYVLRHYEITEEFIQELNSLAIESLSFYHLQYLSPLQAEFLARWKGEKLFLNGLLQLNPETAKMLVQWKKRGVYLFFSFNGLTYLSKETAQILTQWSGRKFSFNGLKSIDEETAKALVKWNPKDSFENSVGILFFNGLIELDYKVAQALSQWQGKLLFLNGLRELDENSAKALVQWKGEKLSLNSLCVINEGGVDALAQFHCAIETTQEITEKLNKQFEKLNKEMEAILEGFKKESQQDLATQTFEELTGLEIIRDKELFNTLLQKYNENSENFLFLNHWKKISIEQVKILIQWGGELFLNGVTELNIETAQLLSTYVGTGLYLNGLAYLDKETFQLLTSWEEYQVYREESISTMVQFMWNIWIPKKIVDSIDFSV